MFYGYSRVIFREYIGGRLYILCYLNTEFSVYQHSTLLLKKLTYHIFTNKSSVLVYSTRINILIAYIRLNTQSEKSDIFDAF